MHRVHAPGVVTQSPAAISVLRGPCSQNVRVLCLDGPLRVPLKRDLRREVLSRLRDGTRTVVMDLAAVPTIDAAGVGQLVRAYNAMRAGNGTLRIVRATARVRETLQRVKLFDLLSAGR